MGQKLNSFVTGLGRFFEYPVKRKPICFYRQEDFSATGERIPENILVEEPTKSTYDKLVEVFYSRLLEMRCYNQEMKEKDKRYSVQKVVERFPGWDEVTIANLHSLFLLFDNQLNGMLGFEDFGAVLESLGDENSMEKRKEQFEEADSDEDGWITYDEFLELVYNFDSQEEGQLSGLPNLCRDVADNINFVSNLTVGEQLEYGLF